MTAAGGSVWVWGAFEPTTGLATMLCSPRRDSTSFIQLLELVLRTYPAQEWVLIADNLTTHLSRETQTALLAWPEVHLLLLPKYACWLNLIEPWWKQLRGLALKGRRFEHIDEVIELTRSSRRSGRPPSIGMRIAISMSGKSCLTLEKDHLEL
jgi:transposase